MFFAMMVVLLSSCAVDMPIKKILPSTDADIQNLASNVHGDVSGMRQCLYVDNSVIIFPSVDGEDTIIVKSYDPIATVFLTVLITIFSCCAFYLIIFNNWKQNK
jgi:hypothetical protein